MNYPEGAHFDMKNWKNNISLDLFMKIKVVYRG